MDRAEQLTVWLTALAATASGARRAARWLRETMQRTRERRAAIAAIPALVHQVNTIHKELTPNGGGSIKDAIMRIDRRQVMSDKRTWALLAESTTAIFECDATGSVLNVNRTYVRFTGRERDDLTGQRWLASVADPDRARVADEWRHAVDDQRECRLAYLLEHTDGRRLEVVCYSVVVRDDKGALLGFIGSIARMPTPATAVREAA
jgi:PAS domain S-box-containing protein